MFLCFSHDADTESIPFSLSPFSLYPFYPSYQSKHNVPYIIHYTIAQYSHKISHPAKKSNQTSTYTFFLKHRSSLHDHIMGRGKLWTSTHDGRALVTANYAALVAGKKKMEEAVARQIEVAAAVKEGKGSEKEVEDMTVFA